MRYSVSKSSRHSRCALISFIVLAVVFGGCGRTKKLEEDLVRISGKTFSKASLDALSKMRRMYPTQTGVFFPRERSGITFLVETDVLYEKAKQSSAARKIRAGRDGKWKQKYFLAQLYLYDVLDKNLGFTDDEIESYYNSNKASFSATVQVPRDTISVAADSGKTRDSIIYRDSAYIRPVGQVQTEIAEKLFFAKYPPDSAFRAKHAADSTVDSAEYRKQWVYTVRNNPPAFFMKKVYEKKTGTAFPESHDVWYGKGKMIAPEDMEVILSWIPEQQREMYRSDTSRSRELAEWLLKWEIFSWEAQAKGYARKADVREVLRWAEKFEVVTKYVDEEMAPRAKGLVSIDTAMCLYAYWDEKGSIIRKPDTVDFNSTLARITEREIDAVIDGEIYKLRKKKRIEFLQDDWRDDKVKDPAVVIAQADSSRDSGNTKDAESLYRTLVQSFPFTVHGKKAFVELAKIQTENEQYSSAIENYRRYLVTSQADSVNKCNTFFMIGFIYDEYQSKPEMAEVNYTWVLKYMPDCELADDAEFMCAHLDEPMTSVEELRGEAQRQGRDVDDDEPVEDDDQPAVSPGAA